MNLNTSFGWALAVVAVAVGYATWGWPGVLLAFTVVVFWLLLQFSRSLRVLRLAGSKPVAHIDNAVMFNSQLVHGLQMMGVIKLTGSLGQKLSDAPETWRWADAGGDLVDVVLENGRVKAWTLQRAAGDATTAATTSAIPASTPGSTPAAT
jgi:hypothetical protein